MSDGRFQEGNVASLHHGARSERTVKRVATVQKRRLLRQIGLRAGQLDGIGQAYLDTWARSQAKVELLDQWYGERGFLEDDGKLAPSVQAYFTAVNTTRLSLAKLEDHLRKRHGVSPVEALAAEGRRVRERAEGLRAVE